MSGDQLPLGLAGEADPLPIEEVQRRDRIRANPMIPIYGEGPEGTTCASCVHLVLQGGTSGRYLKCELRRNTRGPATDHRARWPACGKYEEAAP